MKGTTQQTGSENPALIDNDTLALIIKCPACDTQRAFRVNDSMTLVLTRQSSGCEHSTWCEVCGYCISVQHVWTRRHPGWVAEGIAFQKAVTVEDTIGMSKTIGRKEI